MNHDTMQENQRQAPAGNSYKIQTKGGNRDLLPNMIQGTEKTLTTYKFIIYSPIVYCFQESMYAGL